ALVRGYADTYKRGLANWGRIVECVIEPMLAGQLSRTHFADAVLQARLAAAKDPEGEALAKTIAAIRPAAASEQAAEGAAAQRPPFETLDNIDARSGVGEALETAGSGDLLGHAHEPTPGRTRQRSPDADAPDPELGEVAHGQIAWEPHQEVDGLGRHRPDHSFDLLGG